MLSTARQPESLLLQHTKLATSDSQSRHGEEGSRSQSTEAELGSGIGGAGKIVAEGEVRENLPWEGGRGGGDGNPRASAHHCLPPVLFSSQMGLHLRQCPWKALPKVSQSRLGFFFSILPRLPRHTLPSGHKEVSYGCESGGQRPSSRARQPSLFSFLGTETLLPPSHCSSQERPRGSHSPRHGEVGSPRPAAAPRFFTFSLRPAGVQAKTRRGDLGKGITLGASRPSDPGSGFSWMPRLKACGASVLEKHTPAPHLPVRGAQPSQVPGRLLRPSFFCFSNSNSGAPSKSPIQEN